MNRQAAFLVGGLTILSIILRSQLLFVISILLWLVLGVSWLWARYCLVALTYQRQLGATRLYFGEETDLRMEIVNAKPLPLPWLEPRSGLSLPSSTTAS